MATQNQFVVTVADCLLRDTVNDLIVLKAKTLLSSAFTQSMESLEIKGGQANALLYDYAYGKTLSASLEDAVWKEDYIALNNGVSILTGLQDYWILDEEVTLVANVGTLAQTPVGKVYVEDANGNYSTITPTGTSFTVPGGGTTTVKCSYQYNVSVDSITINTSSFPSSFELTMFTSIMNATGKVADVQIIVPNFKPSGSFDISFGAATAATGKLDGKALANDDNEYAYVYIKAASAASITYTDIAATPSTVALTTAETEQLSVIGIRGGLYGNTTLDVGDCTYASSAEGVATVGTGGSDDGLITYVGDGTAIITVTHGVQTSLKDYVSVTCSS